MEYNYDITITIQSRIDGSSRTETLRNVSPHFLKELGLNIPSFDEDCIQDFTLGRTERCRAKIKSSKYIGSYTTV